MRDLNKEDKRKLSILFFTLIVVVIMFIFIGLNKLNYDYSLNLRLKKIFAIFLTGISIGTSTVLFQTVTNNRILTPKSDNGLLRGIIREWIMKNFVVEECNLTYYDLKDAEEVFITNSLMGVMKVNKIDKFTYRREEIKLGIFNKYIEVISGLGDKI